MIRFSCRSAQRGSLIAGILQEYINLLLTAYFFVLGVLAVAHVLAPLAAPYAPAALKTPFALDFTKGEGEEKQGVCDDATSVGYWVLVYRRGLNRL